MSVLRSKLQETREEHVLQSAQHSVYVLASQHCVAVVASLLGSPLPFDRYLVSTVRGPCAPVPTCLCTWCLLLGAGETPRPGVTVFPGFSGHPGLVSLLLACPL